MQFIKEEKLIVKLPEATHELLYFIKQKANDDDVDFAQLVFVTLTPKHPKRSTKKHPHDEGLIHKNLRAL